MRLILVLVISACLGIAQTAATPNQGTVDGVSYAFGPMGFPCEPGDYTFGLFPCPPFESQGVMLYLYSPDTSFDEYRVTIDWVDMEGKKRSVTEQMSRMKEGWSARGFAIGRIRTPSLGGVNVTGVSIAKVKIAGAFSFIPEYAVVR